jgi:hypothetical protein
MWQRSCARNEGRNEFLHPERQNTTAGILRGKERQPERKMLTQKRLREIMHYDPEAGAFRWVSGRRRGLQAGTLHDARGFLKAKINGRTYPLHHLAWLWMTGFLPSHDVVHIDGDRGNNAWSNLRAGTRTQGDIYRQGLVPRSAGAEGILLYAGRFHALIDTQPVRPNVGDFETLQEAVNARAYAIRKGRQRQRECFDLVA